jgi:hypothetical protein
MNRVKRAARTGAYLAYLEGRIREVLADGQGRTRAELVAAMMLAPGSWRMFHTALLRLVLAGDVDRVPGPCPGDPHVYTRRLPRS